jgi:enoyl-CoA hydratase/carnithine racemase
MNAAEPQLPDGLSEFLAAAGKPTVPVTPFSEYAEMFKDAFVLTREDGICEIRMHLDGDAATFTAAHHSGWPQILRYVGADPENEVVIITGTGDYFVKPVPPHILDFVKQNIKGDLPAELRRHVTLYRDGVRLVKNIIEEIDVPTVGVLNGPAGAMSALATLCDITISSDTATLEEGHFADNLVPADGTWQAFAGLSGIKRAAYLAYTHQVIDAQTALEWGIVNEVVPHEEVNARAWAIARDLMAKSTHVRRVTHTIVKEYYADMIAKLPLQFAAEAWAIPLSTMIDDE